MPFFSEKGVTGDVFLSFRSKLSAFSHCLVRCGSIFGGPDPQKVMTLTGISHFFDFLKNRKKSPTGTPKWSPNGQELAKKLPKIAKMAKTSSFLRRHFFDDFWGH